MIRPGCNVEDLGLPLAGPVTTLGATQVFTVQALGDNIVGSWTLPQFVGCARVSNHQLKSVSGDCLVAVEKMSAKCYYFYREPVNPTYVHCTNQVQVMSPGQSYGSGTIELTPKKRWFLTGVPAMAIPFTPKEEPLEETPIGSAPRSGNPPTTGPANPLKPWVKESGGNTSGGLGGGGRASDRSVGTGNPAFSGDGCGNSGPVGSRPVTIPPIPVTLPDTEQPPIDEPDGIGPLIGDYGLIYVNGLEVPYAGTGPYDVTEWVVDGLNSVEIVDGVAESNFYLVPGYYLDLDGPNPFGILTIAYNWEGSSDLDSATTFLGETLGYGHEDNSRFMSWLGDKAVKPETVFIDLASAHMEGEIRGSATITCASEWYPYSDSGDPIGSNPTLTVSYEANGVSVSVVLPSTNRIIVVGEDGSISGVSAGRSASQQTDPDAVIKVSDECYRFVGWPDWKMHYSKTVSVDFEVEADGVTDQSVSVAIKDADPCGDNDECGCECDG